MSKILAFAAILALAAAAHGCGDSNPAGSACSQAEPRTPSAAKKQDSPRIQETCPVMGGKINKSIFADHDGKRVYFCCAPCAEEFAKNPAKYLKIMADKGETAEKTPSKP